jgi:hypothetical protein
MASEPDKAMPENLNFALSWLTRSCYPQTKNPNDALIKAIWTLAQVIYIITPDDQREQTLNDTMGFVETHLELLEDGCRP